MSGFDCIKKEIINKGWSCDKKFCVTTDDGTKYLLRITPLAKSANREELFRLLKQSAALGVPMCEPVEFGECDEGFYILQTWIEGRDAEEIMPSFSEGEQYMFGVEAGKILKKIHTIPAPENQPDWETRTNNKIEVKIDNYNNCTEKYENGDVFIDFINANRHLLKSRPQCFQHGDYHIGNMMIESGRIVIIDFDRYDFGDPWEEFKSIIWCARKSPAFASGMINGYFNGDVPAEFWKLLALYTSMWAVLSLPWATQFGDAEIQKIKTIADEVLIWYDNMRNPVPYWYNCVADN